MSVMRKCWFGVLVTGLIGVIGFNLYTIGRARWQEGLDSVETARRDLPLPELTASHVTRAVSLAIAPPLARAEALTEALGAIRGIENVRTTAGDRLHVTLTIGAPVKLSVLQLAFTSAGSAILEAESAVRGDLRLYVAGPD
jgi:hypothetical protein